jgi:DNA-binding NarL/FixJ family response regulator
MMTLADLQTISAFGGWTRVPRTGPRLPLTPRERQVLESVLSGRTHKEVAYDLCVATPTVRVLYARGMKKLGLARLPPGGPLAPGGDAGAPPVAAAG